MKKVVIVLVVALVSSTSETFQGSQLIQQEYNHEHTRSSFLDADRSKDEYEHNEENQNDINEYDQYICDDVRPPKISAAKALLAEVLGFVLVRYITMREIVYTYSKELKDVINRWFTMVVNCRY